MGEKYPNRNEEAQKALYEAVDHAQETGALVPYAEGSIAQRGTFSETTDITTNNPDGTRTYIRTVEREGLDIGSVGSTFNTAPGEKEIVYATTTGGPISRQEYGDGSIRDLAAADPNQTVTVSHRHESGPNTETVLTGARAERARTILMQRAARNVGAAALRRIDVVDADANKATKDEYYGNSIATNFNDTRVG